MISYFRSKGFTLIEMAFGILMLGLVLVAFANIFALFQRSATTTRDYADTQQNARLAIDYLTEYLRQAGAGTDYTGGQRQIVHAGPYQIAINADIDNSETIGGEGPLSSISISHAPAQVPPSGTVVYAPSENYGSEAETVVLTLDSESDGTVDAGDQGDDSEEGKNPKLYVLKRVVYGYDGAMKNEVRSSNLALVRGPDPYKNGTRPQPLFQYYYDHDEDDATPDKLWGDADANGALNDAEIAALTNMPDNLLGVIRKIHVTVVSESETYDNRVADISDGYRAVTMNSEIYVRNTSRLKATVYGYVYHDVNADGVQDTGETGLPNVEIKIGATRSVATNGFGVYSAALGAGTYTIEELDPAGYSSTTANTVSVTLNQGEVKRLDFGDKTSSSTGVIKGIVFHDINGNGSLEAGEPGLQGITVSVDNGVVLHTDDQGQYSLVVPLGTYMVTETDPAGWASSTANTITANITTPGQTSANNFGDVENPLYGRIEGYVFDDENKNGARDLGDAGLPNVTLTLNTGDSTHTDATGYYYFDLMGATYAITERDPAGYSSSTPNTVLNLVVVPDTLITVDFADFENSASGFDEVAIGAVKNATRIALGYFKEGSPKDLDIVVGSARSGGAGNLSVFHNQWQNSSTPITQLFDKTPTYQRDAGADVTSLIARDLNSDGATGVLTGLATSTANNMKIWANNGSGTLGATPATELMSKGGTNVLSSKLADLNADGRPDLVLGLGSASGTFTGAFEIYMNSGGFNLSQHETATNYGITLLGEIHAVDAGDVDGDGDMDIVLGSHDSDYTGFVDLWENTGYNSGYFQWKARYVSPGAVNALRIIDLSEDNNGDADIVAAVATQPLKGALCAWYADNGVFGDTGGVAVPAGAGVMPTVPDGMYDTQGEPLSLDVHFVTADIFPDFVVGTRSTAFYGGDLHFVATRGAMSVAATRLNGSFTGEYVAVAIGDLNNDYKLDIVTSTKVSPSQGKLLLYINNGGGK